MSAGAFIGEDVVGIQGQALTDDELTVLVRLADGDTPSTIAAAVGVDRFGLRHIEQRLTAKLGARSKPHMIARGFVLGVLAPRALCLLLAALSINTYSGDAMANRSPRRTRTPVTSMRASRSHRASNDGNAPLPPFPDLTLKVS